jgi:hypothetical protein
LRSLPVKQGIAGITTLIRHLRARTHQGSLMMIALAWWQQTAGTNIPLLEDPTALVPYNQAHLLSAHRSFLASIGGSLYIDDMRRTQPPPLRTNDICIMDIVASLPTCKSATQAAFNRVRLHLGITYLSEIATADGTCLAHDAWEGYRPWISPFLWPYQPCPGSSHSACGAGSLLTSF